MRLQTLQWIVAGVVLGLIAGIGGYTFICAKRYSYMTNNPGACANCHVMHQCYDGRLKSSHRSAAG